MNLKPDLSKLIYMAAGFLVLPKVISFVRSKVG
jgi:hypothetical protein